MNWEVSTMPSKRSFFNSTLFRKNLSRSWPLWGGLSVLGGLVPLYMLLETLSRRGYNAEFDSMDFGSLLYSVTAEALPFLAAGYALLCAMVVWSYLDSPRAVGFMHSLPIDRGGLFLTNLASGFAMMLIPYAIVGGLLCLEGLIFGFFNFLAVMQTVAAVVLLHLLFFGLATLCAMLAGNIFAMPALYLVLNVAAPLLSGLMNSYIGAFLVGVPNQISTVSNWFAPLIAVTNALDVNYMAEAVQLRGLLTVALYGLVGAALLGLSFLLCRRRASERAGDVVAFRWLRPVFRGAVALLSAFTLGWLLYVLLWGELFQKGSYADLLPMICCTILCGAVGYYGASMLLEKTFRVFHRRSLAGILLVGVAVAAVNLAVGLDIFGLEKNIPQQKEIQEMEVYVDGMALHPEWTLGQDDQLLEKMLGLHRAVLDEVDTIRDTPKAGYWENYRPTYVSFNYILRSGENVRWTYDLPIDMDAEDWRETAVAYDDAVGEFSADPVVQLGGLQSPVGSQLREVGVYSADHSAEKFLGTEDSAVVYGALQRDAQAGRLPGWTMGEYVSHARVEVEFSRSLESGRPGASGGYTLSVPLTADMTETLAALVQCGIPEEEVQSLLTSDPKRGPTG